MAKKKEALAKDDWLEKHGQPQKPELLHDCDICGLSRRQYQRFQAMRAEAAQKAIGVEGIDSDEEFRLSEDVAWLTLGVVQPTLTAEEWRAALDSARGGLIQEVIQKIKELTGAVDLEVELAKKILSAMPGGLPK